MKIFSQHFSSERLNTGALLLFKMEVPPIQKSCQYCGRIHTEGYICSKKPIKRKKIDDAVRFRNSSEWNRKRLEIRARDNYLCQICIRELYGTRRKYNCEDLQVHHVVPINANEALRLDNSNLITLCSMHHAMCDRGEIPYDEVRKIISEQEKSSCFRLSPPLGYSTKPGVEPKTDGPPKFTPRKLNVSFLECVTNYKKSRKY